MFGGGRLVAIVLSAIVLSGLVAAGCGSSHTRPLTESQLVSELRRRGVDPQEIVIPFELDEKMDRWVLQSVPEFGTTSERLDFLLTGLLSPRRLHIRYEGGYTGTAEEVFESRTANCLSFTSLFVGMARRAGIPAYYLEVGGVEGYQRDGDLVIVSGHITAGYGTNQERKILEFNLGPQIEKRRVEPISDVTAIALHYTNRSAELLRGGDVGAAVAAAETAIRLDPTRAGAWVNKGVALRRGGDFEAAEAAYRQALALEPEFETAYQDLAALLRLQGRVEEADELAAELEDIGRRNPYSLLSQGDLSLRRGEIAEAREYYRRALRRLRDEADPYAAVGLAELAAGNRAEAQRWLIRAQRIDPEAPRVRTLEARMARAETELGDAFVRFVSPPPLPPAEKPAGDETEPPPHRDAPAP
jgi:tetratricopeptide (TPR) repeat protein